MTLTILRFITTTILCFFFIIFSQARHIIGGDISYTCNGDGTYHIVMKIYRDCSNPNADFFDNNAPVTIFQGNEAPYSTFQHIYAPLQTPVSMIHPDLSNPCLILPSNICVQLGLYEFDLGLPPSDESYHITYQRCCRNNTVTNLIDPDETGATYSIEITPQAQDLCNNSPVFNDFPPLVICAGEPLNFDHSASDADGDQLVYEMCSPLKGAGVVGFLEPGDPASCNGFRPDPACPPPFDNVDFVLPDYTPLRPLAGDPVVGIDPTTGIISGTPMIQGQFVVGICVSEYRNGALLSQIRRDFQFNVTNCEPTIEAVIDAEVVPGTNHYLIASCDNPIIIQNESFQQQFIDEFYWEFDINGQIETVNTWDPIMTFPQHGTYTGKLFINPGTECGDTAFLTINLSPPLTADFSFEYDTCVAAAVQFTDLSTTEATIDTWNWTFGDGQTGTEQDPAHIYQNPGTFNATLRVTDELGCQDIIVKNFDYLPAPALIVIAPNTFLGCLPADIFFDNLSFPIDDTYDIVWDFGDGGSSGEISPTHLYDVSGYYDVSVSITSPIGCTTDTIFPSLIEVQPAPVADFSFSPIAPSQLNPQIDFTDQSQDAIAWFWDFNGLGQSFVENPVFKFPDTGLQAVTLLVTHPEGCQDSITQIIDIKPEIRYFLPNAFTPNEDTNNDIFIGVGTLTGVTDYQMMIWNRWGELVFESQDPKEGWNGRKHNSGQMSQNGVYLCKVRFTGPRGTFHEVEGMATLIR